MGDVRVAITIENTHTGARSDELIGLADTGATLTVVPADVLDAIGVRRLRRGSFVLADGRRVERDVGDAAVTTNGEAVPCRVVFGHASDATVLGVTALEQLGLAVDPVQRRLVPSDFLL
jgi:aspartyl protease family protein